MIATALLYVESDSADLHVALNTTATPLNRRGEAELSPGRVCCQRSMRGCGRTPRRAVKSRVPIFVF